MRLGPVRSGQDVGFKVAVTADGFDAHGRCLHGDLPLEMLTAAGIEWSVLSDCCPESIREGLRGVDALLSMGGQAVGESALELADSLRLISRFGSGYDAIDVDACTARGVIVTNTPRAVRRPLAVAALTMLLALSHNLLAKDRLTRDSQWADRGAFRGASLRRATLGIVGFGGAASELANLVRPLEMKIIGNNRSGGYLGAEEQGVEFVAVDDLLERSDYVVLMAPLTTETRQIVDREALCRMKTSAMLINVGRGGLVETAALREALTAGWIAGAGLDVFDPEPPAADDPLLSMSNVVLSPHSLCWTEDFTRAVAEDAVQAIIDVASGRTPANVVNTAVLDE